MIKFWLLVFHATESTHSSMEAAGIVPHPDAPADTQANTPFYSSLPSAVCKTMVATFRIKYMLFWTLCLEVKQDNVKQTAKSFVPFFCCVSPSSLNNHLAVGSNLVEVIPGGIASTKIVTNSQRANITKNEHLHNAISYISVFSAGTLRSRIQHINNSFLHFSLKHQFLQTGTTIFLCGV